MTKWSAVVYKPVCNFFIRCSSAIAFAPVMLMKGIWMWSKVASGRMSHWLIHLLTGKTQTRPWKPIFGQLYIRTGVIQTQILCFCAKSFCLAIDQNIMSVFSFQLSLCTALSLEVFPYNSGSSYLAWIKLSRSISASFWNHCLKLHRSYSSWES